jgi:hypothetical protein
MQAISGGKPQIEVVSGSRQLSVSTAPLALKQAKLESFRHETAGLSHKRTAIGPAVEGGRLRGYGKCIM